jgi:[NiFe] hydrogenase assembly HybE family chaperone
MTDATSLKACIETTFRLIQQNRMSDVPILNEALQVEVVGLQARGTDWLCVLVTPWFMNLLLLPQDGSDGTWSNLSPGQTRMQTFPGGNLPFIANFEQGIGFYLSCSMFSPVFEFATQALAVETAEAVLTEVLAEASHGGTDDSPEAEAWKHILSPDAVKPETGEPAEPEALPTPAETAELAMPERRKLFGMKALPLVRERA